MGTSTPTPTSPGKHLNGSGFDYSESLTDQHIRLLHLNFGHGDEMVRLDIKTYSIDDHPPYIALSYTWGNPKDTVPILCNGKVINVTRNLKEALWQFREDDKRLMSPESSATPHGQSLYLWVDAICIDQENEEEKSFQVGLMAEIYHRACHVFVWLGPADNSSDVAIHCINDVSARARVYGIEYTLYVVSGWNGQDNFLPITELKNFFTRPWWARMWVLQEITLSRDTHLICGAQKLSRTSCELFILLYAEMWNFIVVACQKGRTSFNEYRYKILENLFHHRPHILLSMPRIYHESKFPLAALIRATCVGTINPNRHGPHNLESTKPQDKIFALLGLAADREDLERYGVAPKYGIPYEQIYAITMAALLQQGHISMLSMCQVPRSPNLPSWVPDWSKSVTDMLQDIRNDHVTVYPEFNSSGTQPNRPSVKILKDDGFIRRISIKGCMYDEIYQVGHFTNRTDSRVVPPEHTYSWPIEWLLEIIRLSYCRKKDYKGFHNRLRASARTSIGDVGSGEDGEFERVGNARFNDAVILLHYGRDHTRNGRFKFEAQRFMGSPAIKIVVQNWTKNHNKIKNDPQLVSEILGKSLGRVPFVTQKGHLGLSSDRIRQGDKIAIIAGSQVPFVLRSEDKGQFSLVSEAYVDGIMDGEVARTSDFRDITLV